MNGYHPDKPPVSVGADVTNVQVTSCAGYNDQGSVLTGPTSPPKGTFHNTTFDYYGPIAFYVWGGNSVVITIDGVPTGLTSGGFTLAPGKESAEITHGTGIPNFFAVGK
ncbi:MAG: hypothetical protein JO104_04095 [Candidatus Eremiobacteraeota bacterium]|nr:hypothetical protein [Candidatus Eremiobacteraeota bacterium]